MNKLRAQTAAKRRIKARNDILGLLKNAHSRCSKAKEKPMFTKKQYGIFSKALTFKVLRQEADDVDRLENNPERLIFIPVERDQVLQSPVNSQLIESTSKMKIPLKNVQKQKANLRKIKTPLEQCVSKKQSHETLLLSKTASYCDESLDNIRYASTFSENSMVVENIDLTKSSIPDNFDDNNGNFSFHIQKPIEFEFGSQSRLDKSLLIESIISSNLQKHNFSSSSESFDSNGSISFNSVESQTVVSNDTMSMDSSCIRLNPYEKRMDNEIHFSGFSLYTPDFSQENNSLSCSSLQPMDFSNQEQSELKSCSIFQKENSSFTNSFDDTTHLPEFTMEMMMASKSKGAKHAYQRLFLVQDLIRDKWDPIQNQLNSINTKPTATTSEFTHSFVSSSRTDSLSSGFSTFNQTNKPKLSKEVIMQQKRLFARKQIKQLLQTRYATSKNV